MPRSRPVDAGLLLLLLAACAKRQQTPPPASAEAAVAEGLDAMRARRFSLAEDRLTFVIFNYPGSLAASDAQFYLAEAYYESGDYTRAQTEYDFYIQNFPSGRFQEDAAFKLALANLRSAPGHTRDQTRVLRARELLDDFVDAYPASPLLPRAESARAAIRGRLAQREFEAARLYFRAGEYGSALVYYEYIRQAFSDSLWQPADRERLAACYELTGRGGPGPDAPVPVFEVFYFQRGSAELGAADSTALLRVVAEMSARPGSAAAVTGHCDSTEAATMDVARPPLGLLRALAVRGFLVRAGIDSLRVRAVDSGTSRRASRSDDDAALDRRAELLLP
ncbi:outer membrane protein assembly factor BamD [candidate division WOR-3 bacterium]|nr:outer membrane protein assembly factor BamD [candidate division WOR-3 bacterium]